MELVLLLILIIIEIGFTVFEFTKKSTKGNWTKQRLFVNIVQIIIYLLMLIFPEIDFSFRFKGLAILLGIRIIIAFIFWMINRNSSKEKKKSSIIFSSLFSIVLFITSMVPAFIFADYHGRELTGPYQVNECEAILIDPNRKETFEKDGSNREVPVHFYYPEKMDTISPDSLPLVIFSHGAFGYYQSNASTFMELASHGYVVVSLDHPYHSFFTKDSSGKTILVDTEFFQNALTIGSSNGREADVYDITSKWMELRIDDMNFVIDTLKQAGETEQLSDSWYFDKDSKNTIQRIIKTVDFDKIGLMGHSMGGAASVTVGRREDISAVIDLDGTMLGEETGVVDGVIQVNTEPYPTPLLSVDSESHYTDRLEAQKAGYVYPNNVILENAKQSYQTYFKGAEHMNFTDLPLFSPFLAKNLGVGTVDPGECIDKVNALVLQFYDCFLKDSETFVVEESY